MSAYYSRLVDNPIKGIYLSGYIDYTRSPSLYCFFEVLGHYYSALLIEFIINKRVINIRKELLAKSSYYYRIYKENITKVPILFIKVKFAT